ncbi:MAG: hypothetical protein AB7S48_06740 [Bacteroidales bacterium]
MKVIIFYLSSLFLFIGCTKSTKTEQYQKDRNNTADISNQITDIKTNLMFGKSWLYIVDSFLVIEEQKPIGDKGIHLFNKNTFEYITSTGIIGKGPREVTRQGRIAVDHKNKIMWVDDHGKKVRWKFPLDSILNNNYFMPTINADIPIKFFLEEYGFMNDSIVVGKAWDIVNSSTFDNKMAKLDFTKNITTAFGYMHPNATGEKSKFSFKLSLKDSIYINGYLTSDLMTICDLNGNLIRNIYGPDWSTPNEEWRDYFTGIDIINKHIIASFVGKDRFYYDKNSRLKYNWPTRFMVFDLNGNYEATLETGCTIIDFCVDEENGRVIAYFDNRDNPLAFFNFKLN